MTSPMHIRSAFLIWTGWLLLSLFLQAGPEIFRDLLQTGQQTLIAPVLELLATRMQFDSALISQSSPADTVRESLLLENREYVRMIAELRNENSQLRQSAPRQEEVPTEPLTVWNVIPARIIGQRGDRLSESLQLLVSLGTEQGMTPGELALSGPGLLIDQGAGQGISPDQLLTAGRALYGRIVRVGSQTSLVQPVTDPDFRMAVRIVRRSRLGPVQGPGGILAGTGSGCRLDEVSATEAVAAGDDVYTDRLVSPGTHPIYCGRIIDAQAEAGENHWTIHVAPVHTGTNFPAKLSILSAELNSVRIPQSAAPGERHSR